MSSNYTDVYGYEYRQVREHLEIYMRGKFVFSADNYKEARKEILKIENPCRWKYDCGFYDSDLGCTCPSYDKWYACPIESAKPENKMELEEYCKWAMSSSE